VGDGVIFGTSPTRMAPQLERLRELLEKEGRSADGFGVEAIVDFGAGPDAWQRELRFWQEAGGTHVSIRAMDTAAELVGAKRVGYRGPQDYIDALEKFRQVVG